MNNRTLLWGLPVLLYLAFAFWYTNTAGPLTEEEITSFRQQLAEAGFEEDRLERLESFMREDTGRQFLMLNNIDFNENPPTVEGAEPGEDAQQLMGRYMEYMWPALLKRACHPVYMGQAVFYSMDIVGIENAEVWDQAALMRYRSRRDMLDIVSNPAFGGRHEFKTASLDKTIAYPLENVVYFSDPRLLLALVLLVLVSMIDLLVYRRQT